jgi:hypothetical protein
MFRAIYYMVRFVRTTQAYMALVCLSKTQNQEINKLSNKPECKKIVVVNR